MSFASDFALRIESLGYGTTAVDIWVHITPDKPDTAISCFEFSGLPTDKSHGEVVLEGSYVQVQVRAINVGTVQDLIKRIFTSLDYSAFNVGGVEYLYVEGTRSPGKMKVDENNRTTFYCEFKASRRPPWKAQHHSDSLANWSDAVQTALS
jgi:hypothetical protein